MTILLLDDERTVRNVMVTVLSNAGYHVLDASSPEDAIRAAAECPDDIALFITNHRLSAGTTGREVAEHLLPLRPGMRVLHISGYPAEQLQAEGSLTPGGFYLGKPFHPRDLLAKVQEILTPQG